MQRRKKQVLLSAAKGVESWKMSTAPDAANATVNRSVVDAIRACGPALGVQLVAWPSHAGPCAGVVLGPGRHLLVDETFEGSLSATRGGFRSGTLKFTHAQALVAVEVVAREAVFGIYDGCGAALSRALRKPTVAGEYMVVVLLASGSAIVPVIPITALCVGRA